MTDVTNTTTFHAPRWLIVLTAFLALTQAGSAVRAMQMPTDLAAQVSVPRALDFAAGVMWAVLAALVVVLLVQRRSAAQLSAAWLWAGHLAYAALRWLLFVRADYDTNRLPLLMVVALLLFIISVAYILRSSKKHTLLVDEITHTEKVIDNGRKP